MAGIPDYSTTAATNTSVGGVNIAEGWAPSSVNNAIRALMADIATMTQGGPKVAELTVASATTCNILGALSDLIAISGTTTITSLGTGASRLKFVRFTGALILTHNATSLILPGAANITTAAGDCMVVESDASSNVRVLSYQKADGTAIVAPPTVWTGASNAEVTVASASTTDILGAASAFVAISGTTTITSLGTGTNRIRFVRFTGALTLTHNATSLILPTGANMTTAAGDTMIVVSDGSSNARVISYQNSLSVQLAQLAIVAGDIIYGSGTGTVARLAKGSNTNVLTLASGIPSWAAASAGWTPPSSSTLSVGTVALFLCTASSVSNGSTVAGSNLKTAIGNSSNALANSTGTQSGTWRNISGGTVSSSNYGLFVRTA